MSAESFPQDVLELQAFLAPAQPGQLIQAIPAGLGIGGDFPQTNGAPHSRFALFPGTA